MPIIKEYKRVNARGKVVFVKSHNRRVTVVSRSLGSVGQRPYIRLFSNHSAATLLTKKLNSWLSPGEKKYYRIKYSAKIRP